MTTKDESSMRATLAGLGREVYVSQRGLEHVLKELKDKNLLVDDVPSSRSSVKRAREEDFQSCSNRYGALVQELQLPMENDPKKFRTIPFVRPAALMQHMCSHQQFAGFLMQKTGLAVCKHDVPWKLIVYSDEVTPGNALKTKNLRKVQCVYWSLQQLGHRALASESLWFPVVAIRSQVCAEIGGMTVLWKHILELFFSDHDWRAGLFLNTPCGNVTLFAKLGIVVADELGLKQTVESKGASGLVFCVRCSNIVKHDNSAAAHNAAVLPSTCTDASRFRLRTNETTRNLVHFLAEQEEPSSKKRFGQLQTALGFNHRRHGLLMSNIGYQIPECIMFDWFHIYLVHGVVGHECGFLLGTLKDAGVEEDAIDKFVASFKWPVQFEGGNARAILKGGREGKFGPLKGSASGLLSFLPVMRLYVLLMLWNQVSHDAMKACRCFLLLVEVIDTLHKATRGEAVQPADLQAAIRAHAEALLDVYGESCWFPKNHMGLHLGEFLHRHGTLISCWVHERKHKLIKRFATQTSDTSKGYDGNLLKDVLAAQMKAIQHELPSTEVRLLQKRPATRSMTALLREALRCNAACFQARTAVHSGGFECSAGDVVVFKLSGREHVAKVEFHAEVDDRMYTCITPWQYVDNHMYRVRHESMLVDTACICGCCIWSMKDDSALVARP